MLVVSVVEEEWSRIGGGMCAGGVAGQEKSEDVAPGGTGEKVASLLVCEIVALVLKARG